MSSDWQLAAPAAPESARRRLDRKIASIGGGQDQIVRLEQLLDAGLSSRGVRSRVAAGRLHRIHRGVFCLNPPPLDRRQRFRAAVYACGPGSTLSDQLLSLAGWRVVHFTRDQVKHGSERTGRRLLALTRRRRELPAIGS